MISTSPHDELSQKFKKGKRTGSDNESKPNQYVALELEFRSLTTRRPTQFSTIYVNLVSITAIQDAKPQQL